MTEVEADAGLVRIARSRRQHDALRLQRQDLIHRQGVIAPHPHIRAQFAVGPDPKAHLDQVKSYVDAGYDHLVLMNVGPDPDGFLDFFAAELAGPIRAMSR